jgi:hypothetical protein
MTDHPYKAPATGKYILVVIAGLMLSNIALWLIAVGCICYLAGGN